MTPTKIILKCVICHEGFLAQNKRFSYCKDCHKTTRRFYRIFRAMTERCNYKKAINYYNYGERGIRVDWKFLEQFRDDMYPSYLEHVLKFGEKNTSIDRIDNNGNYSKENCRWATRKEQNRNARSNILITFNKKTRCLNEWAEIYNLHRKTLKNRLFKSNWSIRKALFTRPLYEHA